MIRVVPLSVVPCSECHSAVDIASHSKRILRFSLGFWRLDTRRMMVPCDSCAGHFWVYAYPLFNRFSPARVIVGALLLNGCAAALIVKAAIAG